MSIDVNNLHEGVADQMFHFKENNVVGIDFKNFDIQKEIEYAMTHMSKPFGIKVLVKVFVDDGKYAKTKDGKESLILRPDSAVNHTIYNTATGIILACGIRAFKGDMYEEHEEIQFKVGDMVYIPHHIMLGKKFHLQAMPYLLVDDIDISTFKIKTNLAFFMR